LKYLSPGSGMGKGSPAYAGSHTHKERNKGQTEEGDQYTDHWFTIVLAGIRDTTIEIVIQVLIEMMFCLLILRHLVGGFAKFLRFRTGSSIPTSKESRHQKWRR